MNLDVLIAAITKSKNRKFLYHFTRAANLPAIAHFDALWSSGVLYPEGAGERRTGARQVRYRDYVMTINAHLRILDSMLDDSTTQEQFRSTLDQHVFLWPTLRDCRKMMETYARREPEEAFAVLEFDAFTLLAEHASHVKLSKYDSGSSPRFPKLCMYKKSPDMFLPLSEFKTVLRQAVPAKASEVREVLIEGQVRQLSRHLRSVYVQSGTDIPERWMGLAKSWSELMREPSS
ncbi:hypothetical protein WMW72_04965 [Paenibacillus filicis]|uniref:DarT domain-containing protein n=1 Tax=Paenibacillus filicis TaxID=669464 RepID=A0ABU9DER7_9BACL